MNSVDQRRRAWQSIGKLAAISAVVCLVSAGLCGVNWALMIRYGAISGGTPESPRSAELGGILIGTAFIELGGMGLGVLGLVIAGVMALVNFVQGRYAAVGNED